MQILAALFIDGIDVRQPDGGPARIDLTGIQFSARAPHPPPLTWAPHLVVLVRCPTDEPGTGVLEVVYRRDGEEVARNVQPLQVEPGKFSYRLVRGEIDFDTYGSVEAHCRIDLGEPTVVPYTLLPPADDASGEGPHVPEEGGATGSPPPVAANDEPANATAGVGRASPASEGPHVPEEGGATGSPPG